MTSDVLVIVGAGGMGMAIARRLGSGRVVLLADVDAVALDDRAEQLRGEGHEVVTHMVDVSDQASVAKLADAAAGTGRVAQVAHTAGLSGAQAPAEAVVRVDLLGVALVLDEFARVVEPGGAGVVISSMAGHLFPPLPPDQQLALANTPPAELLGLPFVAAFAAGSYGAYGFAKRGNVLRVQAAATTWGARGARINSVSPGVISTPMAQQELASDWGDQVRGIIDLSPAKRLGTPDDIAAAAAFLLGPDSGFITGADLLVDGGAIAALDSSGVRADLTAG